MPTAVREALAAQLAPYRAAHPDVRWTRPETWHLTLLFLGSTLFTEWISMQRHRGYREYQRSTSALIPWPPRRTQTRE